ncbi:DUF559 domain-containing protein [Methylobacterium sp. J-030]|uniref:endonuclease domain-containing protein n=1 Tax=Methylobacterium sp. J-030 TaxID=2836627 RepID=UPI001FB8B0F5|nr:DUF559 domain-containing protein [Methylobacterium sp. J-030]MCJ2071850.1 DUF559 domain-containing protein [Methylobacterium sp. J-030]
MREADPDRTRFRRGLRGSQTEVERRLRYRLRHRRLAGFTFVRQESIDRYVADFCCREARLIVELDGSQHADSGHDRARDAWLTAQGYRVLRFRNAEVATNIVGVTDTIMAALLPSPRGRGEGRDDRVVGAASPKGEGEGAAPVETHPEPPPHPRLPPRCDDDRVVASLSPQAGRGEKHP